MFREADSAIDLSKAALEYGPFLFAILFIIVVPPYAHSIWRRSVENKIPGDARSALLVESRIYFRSSWIFGFILVLFSIAWWGYSGEIAINRATQYIAYTGYVTGLSPEDQLLSISPDENEYLVPSNVDGSILYRFVYLSHEPLVGIRDLYVSYKNSKIDANVPGSGNGYPVLLIPFKIKPGETHYKFITDKTNGAMVVPVGASSS